jgi:hypothetical protein
MYNNQRNVPNLSCAAVANNNSIFATINNDGTYDFHIRSHPPRGGGSDPTPHWKDVVWGWNEFLPNGMSGVDNSKGIYVQFVIFNTKDLTLAKSFLTNHVSDKYKWNLAGTELRYAGSAKWSVIRRRQVSTILATIPSAYADGGT